MIGAPPVPGALVLTAALGAAGAGWLLVRAGSTARASRLCPSATSRFTGWRPTTTERGLALGWLALPTLVVLSGTVVVAGPRVEVTAPLAVAALIAAGTAAALVRRSRARRHARAVGAEVVEGCEALASGLRAGLAPERVLVRVGADLPLFQPVASTARLGGDVAAACRVSASSAPGAERLHLLGAAWEVADRTGAGLAGTVARIAQRVRADEARCRKVDAAVAGARATARLFAVLPVLGIALGQGMDADPLVVMTSTPAGAWCLLVGTALACLGLVWVERLAEGAMP